MNIRAYMSSLDHIAKVNLASEVLAPIEPTTLAEAMSGPHAENWWQAIMDEIEGLLKKGVWTKTRKTRGMKVIPSRFVFKIKRGGDGVIQKWKARLVAGGYRQVEEVHFWETFAPTVPMVAVKILCAIAAALNLHQRDLDFTQAYLNSDIDTPNLYMSYPKGMEELDDDGCPFVLHLHKGLYGLKQGAKLWCDVLHDTLVKLGFVECPVVRSLWKLQHASRGKFYVSAYVDDLQCVFERPEDWKWFCKQVSDQFDCTFSDEETSWLLKLKITRTPDILSLTHENKIIALLEEFGMMDCRTVHSPCDPSVKLTKEQCPKPGSPEEEIMKSSPYCRYRSLVGSLNYIAQVSRPDITFAVSALSRFLANPGPVHFQAALRVLRYLRTCPDLPLKYRHSQEDTSVVLSGYCDASYADDRDAGCRSQSGYVFLLNNIPIDWKSTKQQIVAKSSTEAEYTSLSTCVRQAIYLRSILSFLDCEQQGATIIHEDNIGAIKLADDPLAPGRARHIAVDMHIFRQHVVSGEVDIKYIATQDNIADIFTKALLPRTFLHLRNLLMDDTNE
eukprot:TRINITY_DN10_c0_g1_i1.p1 TRINITY_DN10_c0_g1~~TRINITY_DN10_c0_g1_i1.p1  ORF type:complete len:559 (+),score=71.65 TRINITY_DN10_c0_g1_i1:583-2259(+)